MEGLKRGEKCMFITLEERPEDIIDDVKRFGWDLKKYVDEKKLFLEYHDPFEITDITSPLIDKIKENKVQRVAIDSTAVFGLYYEKPFEVRKQLFKLISSLKETGVTSVLTSEIPHDSITFARFGVEEFITDGLIILQYWSIATEFFGSIEIRKMRRTNHAHGMFPLHVTPDGLKVGKETITPIK
jgi:KaiC/GvpD/RAD55 family RecA-like ATPase